MPHILIVDDEPDTRDMLGGLLTAAGYSIEYAANGWEALLHVDREQYDLILLDIMMSGLDGAKFLSILRTYSARGATPVMIVTALDADEAAKRIAPNVTDGILEKKGGDFYADLIDRVQMVVGPGRQGGFGAN